MAEALGSYGLLGDTRTAALVSEHGSIDWLCVPRFDADPVFGALIDPANGGRWSIKPLDGRITSRAYTENAASIQTEWQGPQGRVRVREGMIGDASSQLLPRSTLVRSIECTEGSARIEMIYRPRLGLPGREPERVRAQGSRVICSWGSVALALGWDGDLTVQPGQACTFDLRAGGSICFVLGVAAREPLVFVPPEQALEHLASDDRWWQRWMERFSYRGPHERNIARGLITLRLLTYAPSGAPVAAPTTSLPAPVGGDQNWDYRFSWPRDASIGVGAFLAFGGNEEPRAFLEWLVNASRITQPRLEVLYNLFGRPVRHEREVADVAGFERSTPVRIGNAASTQHQLDVYGWVIDAAWLMHASGHRLQRSHWRAVHGFADLLAKTWREADSGIWEERGPTRHYVHSKLMAWTGLDRALRLAESYPAGKRAASWLAERDDLAEQIRTRGFDEKANTYRRIFDDDDVDAALLILPVLEFEPDVDKTNGTIDAIRSRLGAGGSLLYRYRHADEPAEGAFLPCAFWLVQALARTGRLDEAETAFDELCALASPLGLYAEQIEPDARAPLGNFPQAFSHATFLQAAAALNEARERSRGSTRTARGPRDR